MMKRLVAVFLMAVSACFACYDANAETGEVATRAWVVKQFKKIGINYRDLNVTVTSNANNTVTFRSDWQSETITNAAAISLTMTPASVVTTLRSVNAPRSRNLFFEILFPTVYADSGSTSTKIKITLKSGYWVDNVNNMHPFNVGSGIEFTMDDEMPEVPSETHTCDIDTSDCNCKYSKMTDAEIKALIPEDYDDYTIVDWAGFVCEITKWIDEDNWSDQTTTKKGTTYWITDEDGIRVSLNEVVYSDAWTAALTDGLAEANKHMKACRDAYKKSLTCDQDNPQHEREKCGSTDICTRNSSHLGPHEWNSTGTSNGASGHTIRCKCGRTSKTEGHSLSGGGSMQYKYDSNNKINGWTIGACSCSKCSYAVAATDHDCVHNYCHSCEGGDGCSLPCQYCYGFHDYDDATSSSCAECQCPGCGINRVMTEHSGSPIPEYTKHGGWYACTNPDHDDPENERSQNGEHCCCSCGYNHCKQNAGFWDSFYNVFFGDRKAESFHNRTVNDPPTYDQISGDDLQHWKCDKSECTRCGDPYGTKENHTWGDEETPHYKYLDNEHCALRKVCEDCDYKKYQDAEDAGSHVHEGNPTRYTCSSASDEICKAWYTCTKCNHEYYEEQNHVKDNSESGGCKCGNCKTYQFEHIYDKTDACGNTRCNCGKVDPSTTEQHKNYTDQGNGTHKCACGRSILGHTWGDWSLTSSTDETDTYTRNCTACTATQTKTVGKGQPPDDCTEDKHIPLAEKCGCVCGYYTPGETVTLSNSDRTVGQASEDDRFHKWAETPTVNGYEPCNCKCGKKHKFREWTTYMKNTRTNYASDFCPVCAYCKEKDRSGNIVDESKHVMKDKVVDGTKCGCKCGKLGTGATLVKFHPKYPGKCRCYGANGDGNGAWHYPLARADCTKVCQCLSADGTSHLANTGTAAVFDPYDTEATYGFHTRVASGCGCKCGEYSGSTLTAAMTNLHNDKGDDYCGCVCGKCTTPHKYPSGQCGCQCGTYGTPHHYASGECRCYCYLSSSGKTGLHDIKAGANGACPLVCHGPCGQASSTLYKYLSLHTPHALYCGCECGVPDLGDFNVNKYEEFHQHRNPSKTCWCYNECAHLFAAADPDCKNMCSNCLFDVKTGLDNSASIHTFTTNAVAYCGCECGRKVNEKHRHSETNCYCYAKNSKSVAHQRKDMNHQWVLTNRELIGEEEECPICGTVSGKYELTYTCKRCGITKTVESYEGCNCIGASEGECDCTTCKCSFCKAGTGYCTTCWKQCRPECKARQSKDDEDEDDEDDGNTEGSDDPRNIL